MKPATRTTHAPAELTAHEVVDLFQSEAKKHRSRPRSLPVDADYAARQLEFAIQHCLNSGVPRGVLFDVLTVAARRVVVGAPIDVAGRKGQLQPPRDSGHWEVSVAGDKAWTIIKALLGRDIRAEGDLHGELRELATLLQPLVQPASKGAPS